MFLYTKSQTLCKKQDNFCYVCLYKNQDTLRYAIFHENFEVNIYTQKAWHFALCDIIIYKKRDTSQKARQFVLSFYIKKSTLRYTIFHGIFEIGGGRGEFYMKKQYTLRYILYAKNALCVTFLYTKIWTLCVTYLY